jgi:tRNA-dihydrouridine synthase
MTLLTLINRCIEQTGVSATRIGREALGDPRLIADIRRGRELRPHTEKKLLAYLSAVESQAGQGE